MKLDERRSRFGALSLVLFLSIFVSACSSSCGKQQPSPAADAAPATAQASSAASNRPSTTSPEISLNNLNGDIAQRLSRLDRSRPSDKLGLVTMLLDRSHYLGKIADLEQAAKIAGDMNDGTADAGPTGDNHYAKAIVANALHRFDDALHELDLATQGGAADLRVRGTRASVFMARGQYDDALLLQLPYIESRDSLSIATAGVLANKMQKPAADVEHFFTLARERFRDVSPFALAWMDFQHGTLFELAGDDAHARVWFAEAIDVLPVYAHAAVHLAPAESPARAIEILEKVKETSDDPEVQAALAVAHTRAGHTAEPPALIEAAKKRYEEIVAKYPEAFADHAARFWLNAGNDPKKALELARLNAKNRPNEESLDLWMATAAGAKENGDVCLAAKAMTSFKYLSARGKSVATAALAKCSN